jgi:hypothetical protein
MKRARGGAGLFGLVLCLCIGLAASALGLKALAGISGAYEPGDILYDEGPDLFQAWLKRHHAAGDLNAAAIAGRILIMPISSRRATVNAMMRPGYWSAIVKSETERRALLGTVEDGLVEALATAPAAGGLWLVASKVRSLTSGFDRQAEAYLKASYLTAPREGDIARLRLVYVAAVGPLMRATMDGDRLRDRETVRTLYPAFDKKYQDWLDTSRRAGIDELRR